MALDPLQTEWDRDLRSDDPLRFPGYADALERIDGESVVTGRTAHYVLIEGNFAVLGGSMGAVAGEKVVRAYRRAVDEELPVVVHTASGGARMQEGMVALVQMARAVAAARDHAAAGLQSVAVYGHPTTGGVFASYASLTDVRAATPGATVGFAGPRVVEQTLGIRLGDDTHTAESAYAAGLVDALVPGAEQAAWVDAALGRRDLPPPRRPALAPRAPGPGRRETAGEAWREVDLARRPDRPTGMDWAASLCSSWVELRGTDPTVRAALGRLDGQRLVVVATDRHAADGRPTPAGFRLAQRAAQLAGRLGLPLLSLVDTPGAHPGPASERDGVAGEIARTFAAFDALPAASVSVCVGEGGSGGALALAHTDRLLVQEHAVFSVIAPEGAAAILLRDQRRAPELAAPLRLTAPDLRALGVADGIVGEDERSMRLALAGAFASATAGDRRNRWDAATAAALR